MSAKFNAEDMHGAFNSKTEQAEVLLKDADKAIEVLYKALKLFEKIKTLPIIGDHFGDVALITEMIGDYVTGKYQEVPLRVVIAAMGAILYLISPLDLIPDLIPIIGWMDDASFITLVLSMGVSAELKKYRSWKENRNVTVKFSDKPYETGQQASFKYSICYRREG